MATANLTAQRLRELLDYNPETGVFTRRISIGRGKAGEVAGGRWFGYWRVCVDYTTYTAHRLAWLYVTGAWPEHEVDHINGDGRDNRFVNLRDVRRQTNSENRRSKGAKRLGAHFVPRVNRWRAMIATSGKRMHLGYFPTEEEAHRAYLAAKRRLHDGCTI
jgi:hypothetical protein